MCCKAYRLSVSFFGLQEVDYVDVDFLYRLTSVSYKPPSELICKQETFLHWVTEFLQKPLHHCTDPAILAACRGCLHSRPRSHVSDGLFCRVCFPSL